MFFSKKPQPIRAEVLASIQATENGPATFSARPAYSGGLLRVAGYSGGIVVDLAGLDVHRKVIANLDHESSKRVGHVTDAQNDGRTLSVEGILSAATCYRDEVVHSHQSGFGWDVSVEIQPTQIEQIAAGQRVQVNGQTFEGPVAVARKSSLFGLSFVGIGADQQNSVSIAAEEHEPAEDPVETFESWAALHGIEIEGLTEQELTLLESIYEKQSKSSEPVEARFDANLIRAEYQNASSKIEAALLAREHSIQRDKLAEIRAAAYEKLRALKTSVCEHEHSGIKFRFEATPIIAETKLACLRATYPQGPTIISSSKDTNMNPQIIQASLHIASGREDLALKAFGEQTTEAARKTGPRNFVEVCEAVIRASGAEVPRDRNEMIRAAFKPVLAGGFSNVSLPDILSNTMGRTLEQAYMETTASWRTFATIKSAADFKAQQSIRPSAAKNLEQVGPAGEIKHQTLGQEAVYNWSVKTWATMETITRQDIINDNLSYFNERPTMHGIGAGRTLNDLIWQTILNFSFVNSKTLALDITNLVAAVAAMKTQKDSQGNSIDIALNTLACPPELEGAARQALHSTELVHGTAGQGNANPAYGIVPNLVVEPRLSNSSFANYAVDNWYLIGSPLSSAVIVGFLNNQELPTIETESAAFNTLGMSLRCFHDFGCAVGDGKALLKSNP